MDDLAERVVELEIRSEERRADVERLEGFVRGYESRIQALEARIARLQDLVRNPPEQMPAPDDDLPPHY